MMVTAIHKWLPENEAKAKKIVDDFARRHSLKLAVYDRHRFWDSVRARLKKVKTTPTVILGKRRFGPNVSAEMLEAAL